MKLPRNRQMKTGTFKTSIVVGMLVFKLGNILNDNKTFIGGGCYLPKPFNTFLDLGNIIFQIILNLV